MGDFNLHGITVPGKSLLCFDPAASPVNEFQKLFPQFFSNQYLSCLRSNFDRIVLSSPVS